MLGNDALCSPATSPAGHLGSLLNSETGIRVDAGMSSSQEAKGGACLAFEVSKYTLSVERSQCAQSKSGQLDWASRASDVVISATGIPSHSLAASLYIVVA